MAFPDYGTPSPTAPNQGKTPQGGLGRIMQSLLGRGGNGSPSTPPQVPPGPGVPGAPMPQPPTPMIPGAPPMPGPGGPLQGAGISPEEYQAILEQIKGELAKQIAGQSGQQDSIYTASAGIGRYRPMSSGTFPPVPLPPPPMLSGPQDVQFPPGMTPGGLDLYRRTGNPNPGMGMSPRLPIPAPPQVPPTNYGPYSR